MSDTFVMYNGGPRHGKWRRVDLRGIHITVPVRRSGGRFEAHRYEVRQLVNVDGFRVAEAFYIPNDEEEAE